MEKKNRTGLQSKISNIFAGVPMPKKEKQPSEHSEPEKKDETSELLSPDINEVVEEKSVNEPRAKLSNLDEDIIEVVLSDDIQVDEQEAEQIKIEPEFSDKPSEEQTPAQELPEEQFAVIEDTDYSNDAPKPVEKKSDNIEYTKKESSDLKAKANTPAEKSSDAYSQNNQILKPKPLEMYLQKSKTLKQDSKIEKPLQDNVVTAPPVKEPIIEKSPVRKRKEIKAKPEPVRKVPRKSYSKKAEKIPKVKSSTGQPKQKAMVVIFIVFSVILVLVLLKNFGFFSSTSVNPGASGTSETSTEPIIVNMKTLKIDWSRPPVYPDGIRDPMGFKPPEEIVEIVEHPDLDVKGTVSVDGGNYLVTINDNDLPFKKDDEIKDKKNRDIKIIDIQKNKVIFEMASVLWSYDLNSKKWIQN